MYADKSLTLSFSGKLLWAVYLVALCALAANYFMHNATYSVDDSYITYRYALNLKDGYGLVFNVGERYYGTTAAGYAILLAALTWLFQHIGAFLGVTSLATIDVPQVSVFVSSMAIAAIGFLLAILARPRSNILKWAACFGGAAALFIATPFNEVAGHETYTFLAAAFGASVLLFVADRPAAAAILFAMAVSFRPDAVLGAAAALMVDWRLSGDNLRNYLQSRRTRIFAGIFALSMLIWLGWLTYYFGTPVPGTMAAKKVQVALGYWPLYSISIVGKYVMGALGFAGSAFVGLGLLLLVLTFDAARKGALTINRGAIAALVSISLFGVLSTVGYLLLNVTFWQWYGVPVVFSLLTAAIAGWIAAFDRAEDLARQIGQQSKWVGLALRSAPLIILVLLSAASLAGLRGWAHSKNNNEHIRAYTEVADFIKAEKPDGAVIQMFEPGSFAYRLGHKYKVVDELGLISPGIAQALKRGDHTFLLNREKPDYLVCSWKGSFTVCDTDIAKAQFEYVGSFNKSFWQPLLNDGARLFRARPYGQKLDTTQVESPPTIEKISNIVLGDKWGLIRKTDDRNTIFVHPGETTETKFDFQCKASCENVVVSARISEPPPEAGADAGDVTIEIVGRPDSPAEHIVVTRHKPAAFQKVSVPADGKLRFAVNNNGNPSFDWLMLTVIDSDTDNKQ